jgi:apolipoprotein N-acyltransferase
MWVWPDQFAAANDFVATQIGLRGHEQSWAIFGLVAAALKLLGLAARASKRWYGFAAGLLVSGLFMSLVFWMIVALSRTLDLPHTITPVALIGFALAAAWQLAEWRPRSVSGGGNAADLCK